MSDSKVFAGGLFAVGLAFLAAFFLFTNGTVTEAAAAEDTAGPNMVITVAGKGDVVIDLRPDLAPQHVERIVELAESGAYDGVVFHRVLEGFMAQTGDVQFGKGDDLSRAGTGGSDLPDLPAEFSDAPYARGAVGMARTNDPNSANSQFFIMFAPAEHLNGQYTVVGNVLEGMEVVDAITRGMPGSGIVETPDVMESVTIAQ
ncbi:peptidylprolyl isomerase [Vannielia litorea]|uniref:peptidylprolyl isomerase n=1 Tax=Vannielia litorea TaxID=1217970 RepID=UPI001C98C8B6|nr:peptidylprolyl isomerase [Vannielia litorea]MBY6047494.1 peptidylprolyl isomerase [Vannielia litorea]MBY6074908.1 peptidylprolyl isomerase [Vannielia litorea]